MPSCIDQQISRHLRSFYHTTPGPITFDCPTALTTDAIASTSLQKLNAIPLHGVVKMRQEPDTGRKWSHWRFKFDHDQRFRNAPLPFTESQHIQLDQLSMTTSACERLATESYSKMMRCKHSSLLKCLWRQSKSIKTEVEIRSQSTEPQLAQSTEPQLAQSAKFAEQHILYTPNKLVENRTTAWTKVLEIHSYIFSHTNQISTRSYCVSYGRRR